MTSSKHDPVHNPRHYTSGAVECIDAIESALGPEGFIAFLRGQVIKYNWRMGQKDAPVQEAGKAKWYMDKLAKALGAGTANWPQSPAQAQSIQGAALTDKKEIQNGTIIDNFIYRSEAYLSSRASGNHRPWRSGDYRGWFCLPTKLLNSFDPQS